MIKDSYLVLDDREIWTEKQCRNYLKEMELEDIVNNLDDYLDDTRNIKEQLACVDTALHGEMEDVIYNLGNQWCVPILDLTKPYDYKDLRVEFIKNDNECVTISIYKKYMGSGSPIVSLHLLDTDIEIYYKPLDKKDNRNFEERLKDYLQEEYIKHATFHIVEQFKINIDNDDIIYGKLDNGDYFMLTDNMNFTTYENKKMYHDKSKNFNLYEELYHIALGDYDKRFDKWETTNDYIKENYYIDDIRLYKDFINNDVI